jgi:hypothetical protein
MWNDGSIKCPEGKNFFGPEKLKLNPIGIGYGKP